MVDYSHELGYWESTINQWVEMGRHYVYAKHMGIECENWWFRVHGKRIIDIGGGPCSMLLQTWDKTEGLIVDPCPYPGWVCARYEGARILMIQIPAERMFWPGFDECWIYNVLQHVEDPEKVLYNAKMSAKVVRIFEWVDIPPYEGHPHMLTEGKLNAWLGTHGTVGQIVAPEWNMVGKAYWAVKEV